MLNIILTVIIGIVAVVGIYLPKMQEIPPVPEVTIWDHHTGEMNLGATSFPTSLDSLTNPSGTDSVATVSHSGQHSNANDAIEALEAKMGTGASTPTSGTLFFGNGSGSSAWNASPSITGLTLSGQGIFGSFISNASSTIVGGLTISGNSTTTNATTTRLAITSLASSTAYFGAGLINCNANNFLIWVGGQFGCDSDDTGSFNINYSYVASSSSSVNDSDASKSVGPFSVVAGDEFLIWGRSLTSGAGSVTLQYKQGTDAASTTLDAVVNNLTAVALGTSVQAYFVATTTTTIRFNIAVLGSVSTGYSSLIVVPI